MSLPVARWEELRLLNEQRERDEKAQIKAEETARHVRRLEEGGSIGKGKPPDETKPRGYIRRAGDNRPIEVTPLPPVKVERKKSGTPTGKNPSMPRGGGRGMSQGEITASNKRQRAGADKRFKTWGQRHRAKLPPDKSVHTIATNAGEAEHRLDEIEADDELMWAKRRAPLPTMGQQEGDWDKDAE